MQNIWFITNPGSGSSTTAKCQAIEALAGERGLTIVGRTDFPEQPLPEPAALDRDGVDTVMLFAGDGTINAAICALSDWHGAILILPGGTMNMLAKTLHGAADPAAIIHAAHDSADVIALPFIEAGEHRAFVGLILGPAASWVRAREMIRKGRIRGLGRAVIHAWRRTFGRGIRLRGVSGLSRSAQAVLVRPDAGTLKVAAIDAREWGSIGKLGWDWMTGDWLAAAAVSEITTEKFRVAGDKPVRALFDGEPHMLDPSQTITAGETRRQFIKTLPPA